MSSARPVSPNHPVADTTTQRAVVVMVVVSTFALALVLSSVTVALPALARGLKLDALLLSWVPLVFLVASAATVLTFGRLADMYGRKRIFTYGTVGIIVSSILIALSPNGATLIGLRVFQGCAAAMLYATQVAILSSVFPPHRRGRMIGIMASAVYFGLTCGPVLGGFCIEHFGWRAAFVVHVPLTLLVLAGIPFVHGEWKAEDPGHFDKVGAALYMGGIVTIIGGSALMPHLPGIVLMLAGAGLMWGFFHYEHDRDHPLFDVTLFYTNRVFTLSSLAALLMYATTFSILVLASLYLQYLKGLPPTKAGMVMLAQPLMVAVFSPLAGRISDHFEPRFISTFGMAVTGIGLVMLAALTPETALTHVVVCLLTTGFGFGLFASPNVNAIMSTIKPNQYGVAGGAVATMRVLGQLCSMGLVATAFALTIGPVEITPETYPALSKALQLSFTVAAALCVPAMFCSLARGKLH
ncbi:MAG: MFS transporter [Gammaproteobacteria bacterium]|nr:MFS transporter [Gammaproteobacteria bacterium]